MTAAVRLPLSPAIRSRAVEVGGGPLAVHEALPDGERRGTVVLVPGYTGSKEDFRLVLPPLAAAGLRAVAYDQRGQYESPGPDDLTAYGVPALAEDLLGLVRSLEDGPVHLVGHSFGGLVARAAVLREPALVRSLVLMGSGPAALTGPRTDAMHFLRPVLEQGGLAAVWEAADALGPRDPRELPVDQELRSFLQARMLAGSPSGLLGMGDALLGEPDRVADLRAAGLPTLVLHGAADDAWSPQVQRDMAERLGAAYVVIGGALHSPAVEAPGATVQALLEHLTRD